MPREFRREYGAELCQVAEEQWTEARAGGAGFFGAVAFWTRQAVALLRVVGSVRESTGETTGGMTMDGFIQDLRHGMRALARRPGFSLLTIVTLGLGIGATTAIFSAVHTVILRPLPYANADEVVVLFRTDLETGERGEGVSASNIRDFNDAATLFDAVAVAEPWSLDLQVDGRVESLRTWTVTRGFFDAIGATPLLGRTFVDSDYDEGGSNLVVIGHRAWVNRFSADPAIIGEQLTLDGEALTVVGVMRSDFRFPDAAEMWIPRMTQPWDANARAADFMTGVARLADGVTLSQARAEATQLSATLREIDPEANSGLLYSLVPLREHLFGNVRTALFVIMTAVGFVLLIACANVAGLMLARGAQRERDYALRGALGAGTGRLVGHVIAESVILAFAGCVLGIVLTYAGVGLIGALGPDHLPRIDELVVDRTVLGFAVLAAALSAILSGLAPSLRLSRPDLRIALGDGARGSSGGRSARRARGRLVVTQVAGAVVLLAGAGLLLRSFGVLLDKELGFDPTDRLVLQIFAYDYSSNAERMTVVQEAMDGMAALPGVTGVAITSDLPGASDGAIAKIDITVPFTIAQRAAPPAGQEPVAAVAQISPDYFDVMDIDVVDGRSFETFDDAATAPVIVVNEALVRRHFGDASPIGEELIVQFGQTAIAREIVGVVRDVRPFGHASQPRPEIFVPLAQVATGSITFVLRAGPGAAGLTQSAMEAVWAANPAQSVYGSTTAEALVSDWLKERQFNLFLISAFSVISLLLSAIGLYGLISFSVERRTGEIGIRRALGGQSQSLVRMVLGEGARLAGSGLVIGLVAAWFLSRFIRGMLFEVQPTDPLTLFGLGVVVFLIAGAATALPALRATRVNPVEALRSE